jgi:membrane dipeptidase
MTRIIVDAHQDLAWNMRDLDRDFRLSAYAKRKAEAGTQRAQRDGLCMTGLPEALLGRVAVIFATIFANPQRSAYTLPSRHMYSTPAEAHEIGMSQLDYYHELADSCPNVALIREQGDLQRVLATWQPDVPFEQHQIGLVVLMEGADPIREPKAFEEWYARGVRIVGLAWSQTRYSGGTAAPGGLTKLGRELLDVMASFRAVLDVSHMAEQAFFEALDAYDGQIIASHSNPRRFRDSDRHLSDLMIRRLVERGGVIGVVPYNAFMWQPEQKPAHKADAPLSRVAEMIDHICQIAGSARHVGIGTDFDGGFGAEDTPDGLDTVADLLSFAPLLAARGYSETDITAILSGNFLGVLRAALP